MIKYPLRTFLSAFLLLMSLSQVACRHAVKSVGADSLSLLDEKSVVLPNSDRIDNSWDAHDAEEMFTSLAPSCLSDDFKTNPGFPLCAKGDTLLACDSYVSSFSPRFLQPVWTFWVLTPGMGKGNVKRGGFTVDERLPYEWQVQKGDYGNLGYTRGHMKPAGDCKYDANVMKECMRMSNMCPQTGKLNAGAWNTVENLCRTSWAKKEKMIFVVCGPIFKSQKLEYIGDAVKIAVPNQFFKVVLSLRQGHEKAIGFIFDNDESSARMEDGVVSLEEVEKCVGFRIFPNLDAEIYEKVKSGKDLSVWTGKYYDEDHNRRKKSRRK